MEAGCGVSQVLGLGQEFGDRALPGVGPRFKGAGHLGVCGRAFPWFHLSYPERFDPRITGPGTRRLFEQTVAGLGPDGAKVRPSSHKFGDEEALLRSAWGVSLDAWNGPGAVKRPRIGCCRAEPWGFIPNVPPPGHNPFKQQARRVGANGSSPLLTRSESCLGLAVVFATGGQ